MIKVITLLSKREGLNRDEFRQYYEEHHRQLGEKYLTGRACRYLRRYVCPEDPATQYGSSPDFDVLMEVWFPDQGVLQEAMTVMATPEAQAEIIADEERLFDRGKTVSFTVVEVESELGQ